MQSGGVHNWFSCVCVCALFFLIESLYPVKTKYIVADFSNGKEIYDEIEQQLSGIPVGILGKQRIIFALCLRFNALNYRILNYDMMINAWLVPWGTAHTEHNNQQNDQIFLSTSFTFSILHAIEFNYILISTF